MTVLGVPRKPVSAEPRPAPADCVHCGLPIPSHRRETGDGFCCEGCRRVHGLILESGLGRFYDLRSSRTAPPASARSRNLAWLDRLLAETGVGDASLPRRLTLDLQGVHCAACVWLLQELFRRWPAGVDLRINPSLGRADVMWDPGRGALVDYLGEAERFGYRFGPLRKTPARASGQLLWRLGICAAAAMNTMMFSLSFYFGLAPADGLLYPLFGWLNLALGSVAVAAGGSLFFRGAWQGLRRGLVHLDLPISVGIALAYAGSAHAQFTRGPEGAYFDSLTIFIALMLTGRWMQERLLERNRASLLADDGVAGLTTRRFRDGRLAVVAATELVTGDEIWIAPGDLVPVDGTLLDPSASVSLDWIHGESDPRVSAQGDRIPAGAFNAGDSLLRLTCREPFGESRLNDLLRPTSPARDRERTAGRWWHRVSTIYVTVVLAVAAAGFAAWISHGSARALEVAVSVLVVTCPCALGLATPLAHDLVHGALRRRGVFVRDSTFLDRALRVRKILFDKTGTLSLGRLALTEESRAELRRLDVRARRALSNLVARSNHPISRSLTAELGGNGAGSRVVSDRGAVREIAGEGIEWRAADSVYRLGRPGFAGARPAREPTERTGPGHAVFSADGEPLAAFEFREELREDVPREIRALETDGLEIHVLSGDTADRVDAAARALALPPHRAHGGLTPEEKAARVTDLDERDTLVVGDGLNDRPGFDAAFAAATPAVDHAALPARADFYYLGAGISAVRTALVLARRLRRVVRDNLIFAAAYNSVALALCLAGVVTPVIAAILMPLSSAAIVTVTGARLSERRLAWR